LNPARGGLAINFGLPPTDERQWMTPVKSFIWAKDAAGIRGECIEMRNRPCGAAEGRVIDNRGGVVENSSRRTKSEACGAFLDANN
jgi:hypothetical protein